MAPQDKVIEWLHRSGELLAEARKTAEGNQYEYGDPYLAELIHDWLYDAQLDDWLASVGVDLDARDALVAKVSEDEFFCIDWEEFRNILLGIKA